MNRSRMTSDAAKDGAHSPKRSRGVSAAGRTKKDGIVEFFLRGGMVESAGGGPESRDELFDLLVATILSQNTNDRNSSKAHRSLRDLAKGRSLECITPGFILSVSRSSIEEAIFSSGYYHA